MGACEAAWRILGFPIHKRTVAVDALGIHLEGQDRLVFDPSNPQPALVHNSDLNLYLNRPDLAEMDALTYVEYYETYVHRTVKDKSSRAIPHPNGKTWVQKRQQGVNVARIYWVHPNLGDLFYLRLLLIHFPARSFRQLQTVQGKHYNTAQEACKAHGLLKGEDEYINTLEEADKEGFQGPQLRRFYVTMVVGHEAPARIIWNKLKHKLAEDFLNHRHRGHDTDWAFNEALIHIARLLEPHGKTLEALGLPPAKGDKSEKERELTRWTREDLEEYVEEWMPRLTPEQRNIYEVLLEAVEEQREGSPRRTFMIDAMGGAGNDLFET